MSEASLRRSARRVRKQSSFNVGDVVEINRSNAPTTGRLIYKLTEGPTPNQRWLVAFDEEACRDEELYEHSFGKVLSKSNEAGASPKRDSPSPTELNKNSSRHRSSKTTTSSKNGGSSSGSHAGSGSDQEGAGSEDRKNRNKKSVTFSEGSPAPSVPSDSSSPTQAINVVKKQSKVSAREERSRRRQAMIHQEAQLSGVKRVRSHSSSSHHKSSSKKARAHEVTDDEEEEVIKVPMKTGTLYLYRGLRRRVEFVRKF